MDNKTKIQIVIALGWFVFIDIAFRTSNTIINTFANAISATQSIFNVLGNTNSFYDSALGKAFYYQDAYPIFLLSIGILIMATIFLLQSLLRIWTSILRLTKVLAYYLMTIAKNQTAEQPEEELMLLLFGERENLLKRTLPSKDNKNLPASRPVVWRLISDISITWLLMGIVYLLYSLFSGLRF
ncbi:hypothetical protein [Candidatus Villigracilis affinis]|uniref:hypothetical protein n=1 Tax=Candidatus Villigracilis affinis TaxID=3140682 RepID=UPI002A200CDE|nr:hypothetical protein [Anaerolineales bacterium]